MVNISCVELPDDVTADVWEGLVNYIEESSSEIVVLNEMALVKWHWGVPDVDLDVAKDAARLHEERMSMIKKLGCSVISSKPVVENDILYTKKSLL